MKKVIVALLAITMLLSGCASFSSGKTKEASSDVRLLAYTGKESSKVSLIPATWNTKTGLIALDTETKPPLVLSGDEYPGVVLSWNGMRHYTVNDHHVSVLEESSDSVFTRYDYQMYQRLFYCDGFNFSITEESEYRFRKDSDEYVFTGAAEISIPEVEALATGDDRKCKIIGAGFWKDSFTVIYACFGEHMQNDSLFYITFSPSDNLMHYSGLIALPENTSFTLYQTFYRFEDTVLVNGVFYYCDDTTIRFYDLVTGKFGMLSDIVETVTKTVPGSTLSGANIGKFVNVTICGNVDDIVIYMLFIESADKTTEYSMYFAVRDKKLLGMLQMGLSDCSISTLDKTGKTLVESNFGGVDFQQRYALSFERTNTGG